MGIQVGGADCQGWPYNQPDIGVGPAGGGTNDSRVLHDSYHAREDYLNDFPSHRNKFEDPGPYGNGAWAVQDKGVVQFVNGFGGFPDVM